MVLRRKFKPDKITAEQRAELVRLFSIGGLDATAELTARYGISPKYPAKAAAVLGIKRPRWRAGVKPLISKRVNCRTGHVNGKIDYSANTFNDRRWAKARAVGVVVA